MKRNLCLILTLIMLLPLLSLMSGCSKAPALDEVRDRVIELVEASHEINELFYGSGLPVYEYGSDEADKMGLYPLDRDVYYEYVKYDAKYRSVSEIKVAAEKVYAKSFLEASVYTTMFIGYAEQGISGMNYARYKEEGAFLCQYRYADDEYNYIKGGKRIYDYDTMVMDKNSNSERIFIKMNTHKEGEKDCTVTLQLVYEYDKWYLATMTY